MISLIIAPLEDSIQTLIKMDVDITHVKMKDLSEEDLNYPGLLVVSDASNGPLKWVLEVLDARANDSVVLASEDNIPASFLEYFFFVRKYPGKHQPESLMKQAVYRSEVPKKDVVLKLLEEV